MDEVRELRKNFGALVIPFDAICDLGTRNHSVRDRERKEGKRAAAAKVAAFCWVSVARILNIMPEPPTQGETWESYFGERRPPSVFRLFRRHLALERKYTEKLIESLHRAISTEMGLMEQRIMAELEEIDASINLIAIELARHAGDPPSNDAGV